MLIAAVGKDGEEADDDDGDGTAGREQQAVVGQLLFLCLVLGVGNGEFRVELGHLRPGFRRLHRVHHFP